MPKKTEMSSDGIGKKRMSVISNWINAYQNELAFVVVWIVVILMYYAEKKRKLIACVSLVSYTLFVFYKTVMSRTLEICTINLELGWSYKEVFRGAPGMLSQIYLNIMLFIPIGGLSGILFLNGIKKRFWLPVIYGFVLTVTIEYFQLTLRCGTFELDDILNNCIGTIIGTSFATIIKRERKKEGRLQ